MAQYLDRVQLRKQWQEALAEDGAENDVTSQLAIEEGAEGKAELVAKAYGVFAGRAILDLLTEAYPTLTVTSKLVDGDRLSPGNVIATLSGPLRLLLSIERTLLNFLQRLSGVASLTRQYVEAVAGTAARVYDTRKTIPGWRQLDKYAVRCGGGCNHRMGLNDAVLVKDNHLTGVPTERLAAAAVDILNRAALLRPPPVFIEFEVDTLDQFAALLGVVGIDVLLLDNFSPAQMREAVADRDALGLAGKVHLEASGGITLNDVKEIAATGVDRISVGALTHSAAALDITMQIAPVVLGGKAYEISTAAQSPGKKKA